VTTSNYLLLSSGYAVWSKQFAVATSCSQICITKSKGMQLTIILLTVSAFLSFSSCSQNNTKQPANNQKDEKEIKVGGRCEGCEAVYESHIPFKELNETDTLPGFNDPGAKIEISGIIYKADGKTPAADVILYIYHTDQKGIYATRGNEQGWAKRHGYIRGWIKTNAQGQYKFYTLVPASYPNSTNPKHIHPVIKEPGKSEYWIDEFVFDDDPLLPEKERTRSRPVGGAGVLKTYMKDGMLRATRNIFLGLNVTDYPK
jgi:protocatechuate 3,4-dioxygenase, beta subunit